MRHHCYWLLLFGLTSSSRINKYTKKGHHLNSCMLLSWKGFQNHPVWPDSNMDIPHCNNFIKPVQYVILYIQFTCLKYAWSLQRNRSTETSDINFALVHPIVAPLKLMETSEKQLQLSEQSPSKPSDNERGITQSCVDVSLKYTVPHTSVAQVTRKCVFCFSCSAPFYWNVIGESDVTWTLFLLCPDLESEEVCWS